MALASLSLLKGKSPAAVQEEIEEEVTTDTAVTVDVDKMSSKQLDDLIKEQEIEVPTEWGSWSVSAKRKWMKDTFEDDGTESEITEEDDALGDPAEAPEETYEITKAPLSAEIEEPEIEVATVMMMPKAKKPKAKSKGMSLANEVLAPDVLSDMVHEIENLKQAEALALVGQLAESAELTFIKLGGVLSLVQGNPKWYEPYTNFREFVEKKHGILYRRAMYWVSIYKALADANIPWEKVAHLGWTKLNVIAGILTQENVDDWAKIAMEQTTLQLEETVKASKAQAASGPVGTASAAVTEITSSPVTTKTFKVHEDQKKTIEMALEKAKEISGSTVDTVALEFICLEYIGKKAKSLQDQLTELGVEDALGVLEKSFPGIDFQVAMPEAAE